MENNNGMPFYNEIAVDIQKHIREKQLPAGSKVPSVRKLAAHYKTSVCTVYKAFEELKYKGIIESKANSGYFVSYDGWNTLFPETPDWDKYLKLGWLRERFVESCFQSNDKTIFLSGFGAGSHFNAEHYLKKAMTACLSKDNFISLGEKSSYFGSLSLRKAISSNMLRYGIDVEPEEILITSGVFNSLNLMRMAFMRAGMDFICENCFATKLNSSYVSLGINKIALPLDEDGIKLDKLTNAIQKGRPTVVCSTFGGHSPYADDKTFGVTSATRKKAILKICNATRTPIIEVDNFRGLYPANASMPLKSMDTHHSVLYIGSLTKSFMQKFRIGWIIGPKEVIKKLADLKIQMEGEQNLVIQEIAAELFTSGLYDEYLENLHNQITETTPIIKSIFEKHLSGIASYNINAITRGVYIRFIDEISLHTMYKNRGDLEFTPGYLLDKEWEQYISVSAITLPPKKLETAISQLSALAKKSYI